MRSLAINTFLCNYVDMVVNQRPVNVMERYIQMLWNITAALSHTIIMRIFQEHKLLAAKRLSPSFQVNFGLSSQNLHC